MFEWITLSLDEALFDIEAALEPPRFAVKLDVFSDSVEWFCKGAACPDPECSAVLVWAKRCCCFAALFLNLTRTTFYCWWWWGPPGLVEIRFRVDADPPPLSVGLSYSA